MRLVPPLQGAPSPGSVAGGGCPPLVRSSPLSMSNPSDIGGGDSRIPTDSLFPSPFVSWKSGLYLLILSNRTPWQAVTAG